MVVEGPYKSAHVSFDHLIHYACAILGQRLIPEIILLDVISA